MRKSRNIGMAPEGRAVISDIPHLAAPDASLQKPAHYRVGHFFLACLAGGIDYAHMLAEKFAGLVPEHAFKL